MGRPRVGDGRDSGERPNRSHLRRRSAPGGRSGAWCAPEPEPVDRGRARVGGAHAPALGRPLGRHAAVRGERRPRRPAGDRGRALARARGGRPRQRRAARPGRPRAALAELQRRRPAAGRGRLVGPLLRHAGGARPPLRRRGRALPGDHRRAVRPPRRALAAPRHHAGDLPAHARRPPAEGALLASRRALGPRVRRRRRRPARAHPPHPRPARRRAPPDRLDRAQRARRPRGAGPPPGRLVAAARRPARRPDPGAPADRGRAARAGRDAPVAPVRARKRGRGSRPADRGHGSAARGARSRRAARAARAPPRGCSLKPRKETTMTPVRTSATGILADDKAERRDELIEMLKKAYWMEIETVMSYIANSINPDGVRAQEIVESLQEDIQEELGHAQRFAERIKELYGVVPGSLAFSAEQTYLQPPEHQTDIVHVIKGVIEAETGAIEHYNRIIEVTDGIDYVTQDMVISILRDEEGHRRLFEGFLREYEVEGLA